MSTKLEETLQIIKKVNQQFKNPVSRLFILILFVYLPTKKKKEENNINRYIQIFLSDLFHFYLNNLQL